MDKAYAKYMKFGGMVAYAGKKYKLVADMNEKEETVKAVSMDNWGRYHMLSAWIMNWEQNSIGFRDRFTGNIEDCRAERTTYEVELKIQDVQPCDKVRFVKTRGHEEFEVTNLSRVLVDGEAAMVVYMDETHFTFADKISTRLYGGCFHIDQFAEICDANNVDVRQIAI